MKGKWKDRINPIKSLRVQLSMIMILIATVPLFISSGLSLEIINSKYDSEIGIKQMYMAKSTSQNVIEFLDTAYLMTEELANNSDIRSFDRERQMEAIRSNIERNGYFELIYIQDVKGEQTARTSGFLGNKADRWWFEKIMDDRRAFIGRSYISSANGNTVCPIVFPVYDNDELKGVLAADVNLSRFQTFANRFNTKRGSEVFIIDSQGTLIAHPDMELVEEQYNYLTMKKRHYDKGQYGQKLVDSSGNFKYHEEDIEVSPRFVQMVEKALSGEEGFVQYEDTDGKNLVSAFTPIELPGNTKNWALITVQKKEDALFFLNGIERLNMVTLAVVTILMVGIGYLIANRITKPIIELSEKFDAASKGDLSVKSECKRKNEIGALSDSFNRMIKNMNKIVMDIKESSHVADDSSKELSLALGEMEAANAQISSAVAQVAVGAGNQAMDARNGVEIVEELNREIESMNDYVLQSKMSSKKIFEANVKSTESVNGLKEKMGNVNEICGEVTAGVRNLNQKVSTIENIVETISDISKKTNLLALNASIEAARAGEAGKGFAVVADEIRNLANNTAQSSGDVARIIDSIKGEIRKSVDAIEKNESVVGEQNLALEDTRRNFDRISMEMEIIVEKVGNMDQSIARVMQLKGKVGEVADNISRVCDETSAATQEVSASIEEQNESIAEISSMSSSLNDTIRNLDKEIVIFKV